MFDSLRKNRSLLMGIAILGIAFYHAPFILHSRGIQFIHDILYCGVDLFLFYSGIGACHSIEKSGGKAYLKKRVRRLIPALLPILIGWSLLMWAIDVMDAVDVLGSVTLVGWWLGRNMQLNWYFSAVWLFFLTAIPLYRVMKQCRKPLALWAAVTLALAALCVFCKLPDPWEMLSARMTVFFTGMLFGRMEQTGFQRIKTVRLLSVCGLVLGMAIVLASELYIAPKYGYVYGLGWLPFLLVIPGWSILASGLGDLLRSIKPMRFLIRIAEQLGDASAEILMVHMAVYKTLMNVAALNNKGWLAVLIGSVVLGIGYRRLVEYIMARLTAKRTVKG